METMNISLPNSLKQFVQEQVAGGGYGNVSEFIRELIREAQRQKARNKLEQLLLEGLESGDPIPATPEFWEKMRNELIERHQTRTDAQ